MCYTSVLSLFSVNSSLTIFLQTLQLKPLLWVLLENQTPKWNKHQQKHQRTRPQHKKQLNLTVCHSLI